MIKEDVPNSKYVLVTLDEYYAAEVVDSTADTVYYQVRRIKPKLFKRTMEWVHFSCISPLKG